jgi:hypothetical protein
MRECLCGEEDVVVVMKYVFVCYCSIVHLIVSRPREHLLSPIRSSTHLDLSFSFCFFLWGIES